MRDILAAVQWIDEVAFDHIKVSAVTARCMAKQFYFCSSVRIGQPVARARSGGQGDSPPTQRGAFTQPAADITQGKAS
jgi:hypothetical protein